MSKIKKWVDLHPRAERLLTDANVPFDNDAQGIINQSEDVQRAKIDAMYRRADAKTAVRAPLSQQELQHHATNLLKGVASRLANSNHIPNLDIRDEATRIMRAVDALRNPTKRNIDAMLRAQITKGTSRVYMTKEQRAADEFERQARNWAARDRRAGEPPMPLWQRVNQLREDAAREHVVVDSKSRSVRKPRNGGTK